MRLKYFLTVFKISSMLFQVLSAKGSGPEREMLIILLVEEMVRVRRLVFPCSCVPREEEYERSQICSSLQQKTRIMKNSFLYTKDGEWQPFPLFIYL